MNYHLKMSQHRLSILFLFLITAFVCTSQALAAALPMPLEAIVDKTTSVVVGKITQIQEDDAGIPTHQGTATIAITEVLQGAPAQTTQFRCFTSGDPDYHGASERRIYSVGDSGIWVFTHDGVRLLPLEQKSEVERILKALSEREWSKPVNGLKACAQIANPDYVRECKIVCANAS